jgi:hypothetical protein
VQSDRLAGIDVARVVKKLADRTGLDAAKYAGHSLRAAQRSNRRRFRALYYAPDRASLGSDGEAVHPGRKSVPGK